MSFPAADGIFFIPLRGKHVLKHTEVITVRGTHKGSLLVLVARYLRFFKSEQSDSQKKLKKRLNVLAIESYMANCHCLFTLGAVAFQTPGLVFDSPARGQ